MAIPGPPNDSSYKHGVFATTHWTVIVRARDSGSAEADSALERLCQIYWYPLYSFVRRKGHSHEDASDLTQAFFARFLEKQSLRLVDESLGKFRTFLLTSMTHFLADEWDKTQAQRRGGGVRVLSFDEAAADQRYLLEPPDYNTPETLFDRHWAQTMMNVVIERLAAETEKKRFAVMNSFLLDNKGAVSYEDAAKELGLSVPAMTSAIHRMRGRFRALLFEEIANTVAKPEDVEQELRHLLAALSD